MDLPDVDVLLSIVAHKSGISPSAYMRKRTRIDFESDVAGWVSSFIYPVNTIAKSFLGDGSDTKKLPPPKPSPESKSDEPLDPEQLRRERRARNIYGWKRRVSGRKYSLVNLDVADKESYKQAVSTMKKDFSQQ